MQADRQIDRQADRHTGIQGDRWHRSKGRRQRDRQIADSRHETYTRYAWVTGVPVCRQDLGVELAQTVVTVPTRI